MAKKQRIPRRQFTSGLICGGLASLLPAQLQGNVTGPHLGRSEELEVAIAQGDLAAVKRLLDQQPHLRSHRDAKGRSVFVLAHLHHQPEIAAEILSRGIDLDIVEAVLANNRERFIELAKANPESVNAVHPIGGNPYYAAAVSGQLKMVWPLNRWGSSPNAAPRGSTGITAFRAAFDHPDKDIAVQLAMRILIDAGDPKAKQRDGNSVLHGAAALGDADLVASVIRRGGDVTSSNSNGETPLALAIRLGNDPAASVLRNHKKIPRMDRSSRFIYTNKGERYNSPESLEVPQLVINEFAEMCHYDFSVSKRIAKEHPQVIHAIASWDELGVEACAHMERADWTQYFLDLGAPMSLTTALAVNDVISARRLLKENRQRITERGPHDFALMWYPQIAGGHVELAELLLEFGADVDEHKLGVTCLHKAAYSGHRELAAFLIEHGAGINLVGQSDFSTLNGTPLDWARSRGQTEIAKLLESHGGTSKNDPKERQ